MTGSSARPDSVAHPKLPYPRSWSFAALLAALAMLGPFAIDMYLPAFHAIALEFAVSQIAVQQTLSTYLFAYAFVMLWHGALSDALGRRPVVLVSLAIYAFASLSCAIAGNIQSLWLFRTLQGLSAGAGLVVGRAIIRDRYHWPEAQRLMSQITLVFGIAPALAPVVGGVLLNALGWRAIFWMMLVLVGAVLARTALRLQETLPKTLRQPLHPRVLWANYSQALRTSDFLLVERNSYAQLRGNLHLRRRGTHLSRSIFWAIDLRICMVLRPADQRHHDRRSVFRAACRSTITESNDPHRLRVHVAGAFFNLLVVAFVTPNVPWHVLPLFRIHDGNQHRDAEPHLAATRPLSRDAGISVFARGLRSICVFGFNAGTIAPFLAHSLASLASGMAALTVASFALWLVYGRRAMLSVL